jgi:hypothetical protein
MALNAFWGKKKIFIINPTNCELGNKIVAALKEADFNGVEALNTINYKKIADEKPVYILSVFEDGRRISVVPYKTEGFVGDRLGHYVTKMFDEDRARHLFEPYFHAAGIEIKENGNEELYWEEAKRYTWFYDDDNKTPFLCLKAENNEATVNAVVEGIKDYFRK